MIFFISFHGDIYQVPAVNAFPAPDRITTLQSLSVDSFWKHSLHSLK